MMGYGASQKLNGILFLRGVGSKTASFTAGAISTRSLDENVGAAATATAANLGAAYTATDADSGDTLTYSLEGTDAGSFSINARPARPHHGRKRAVFVFAGFLLLAGGNARAQVPVPVTAVPVVVESTTEEYFVLYVRHDLDGAGVEIPVLVKRGEAGTTTLAENVEALPKERYRVEKYLVAAPADVDGDGIDDLTELEDPVGMNPVNPAACHRHHQRCREPSQS